MTLKLLSVASLFLIGNLQAQHQHTDFHATMDAKSAKELQVLFPSDINILKIKDNQAAVKVSEKPAHHLHKNILTHGPGFIFKPSEDVALKTLTQDHKKAHKVLDFNITEDILVNKGIALVNESNIRNHILDLEAYGTRYHTTAKAKQAVLDLKTKWENLIAATGRTDISVTLVNHINTPMPSLIFSIKGKVNPEEHIIVGGHLDSIASGSVAPGADDNASGIATITEMIRILLDLKFQPEKTVEFMAFAAEEIGLVGSGEIARDYSSRGVDVLAFVQFDMTNYKGSAQDIYLTTDSYNSNDLNLFLIELMEHYNKTGSHTFTYGNTICNYGCSDHASWAEYGYNAAFPFEARFSDANKAIHSSQDKLSVSGNNANHAVKFAKLGLEFIIEAAKNFDKLSTLESTKQDFKIAIDNKILKIVSNNKIVDLQNITIVDVSGKKVLEKNNISSTVNLDALVNGFYLAIFKTKSGETITKKFILK